MFDFGNIFYSIAVWGISAILLMLTAVIYQSNIRVGNLLAWLVFLGLGSAGGFLALPISSWMGMHGYLVPLGVLAMGFSIPIIHWIIPVLAKDFQTEGFGATMLLSFMVGVAVVVAAFVALGYQGTFPTEGFGEIGPMPRD